MCNTAVKDGMQALLYLVKNMPLKEIHRVYIQVRKWLIMLMNLFYIVDTHKTSCKRRN